MPSWQKDIYPTCKHGNMLTIAIISQKGGTGKTTIALNLAVASEQAGRSAVIVDLDPQASAKQWHDSREADAPIVISAHASRLDDVLIAAKDNGAGLTIIDTAPHSETDALKAARAADLILIPCRPAVLDLRAIASTKELADLSKTPATAVINAAPPRGHLSDEAADAIRGYGLDVAPVTLTQRAAFVHCVTLGQSVLEYEPDGKAAQEVNALCMFACQHANMTSHKVRRKTA
jgi:chromosome partitioning protein